MRNILPVYFTFRLFWFMFILMGISFAIFVCMSTMSSFLADPTVTTLDPQEHSVWDVPFPSIAVCSHNKLSRSAMRQFAHNMSRGSFDMPLYNYWYEKLKLFAGFFNTDSIDFDEAQSLQNVLDRMSRKPFNVARVLKDLAPKCKDLLLECYWSGQAIDCEKELQLVAFSRGYCCVFNYQFERTEETYYYANQSGSDTGLILLLNASTNDYFYAEESLTGFTLLIFGKQKIADTSIGHMGLIQINANDDIHVRLKLVSQITTNEVRNHPVAKRGCYFPNEEKVGAYGQADCLMKCKVRSMESLCNCIPFYVYDEKKNVTDRTPVQCSLEHTECLERYRITWQTYKPPVEMMNEHLEAELIDSLSCPECLPACTYYRYNFYKAKSSLKDTPDSMNYIHSNIRSLNDVSLVKIYYPTPYGTRYQKNVLYNWYQMLSNIGGVIGICMGCSLISGIEVIYFVFIRLTENFMKLRANRR
ncbi:pickpocket protein 11-like [Musca domestica]|uniref:Pickpocket protein 11 n=1 Tax=Musca domestica TaxID=7370 RepID=A0ABM3UVD0_MUSDO|nr:pickpocket protein 11 [Musca domestica]XP_058977476.1 pickpocket protein 11-like [Musca domestica]